MKYYKLKKDLKRLGQNVEVSKLPPIEEVVFSTSITAKVNTIRFSGTNFSDWGILFLVFQAYDNKRNAEGTFSIPVADNTGIENSFMVTRGATDNVATVRVFGDTSVPNRITITFDNELDWAGQVLKMYGIKR